jgi:UDP-galactopyranose mutase
VARVVVVGGGYAGLAGAVRLAKLGHEVTLLERGDVLGGALAPVRQDGFQWDGGPASTLLPAVVRDLFRKSGRPVERELDLVELDLLREHRFEDGSAVRLPFGSRGALVDAVDGLGPGLGERWAAHVASYAEVWDVLRRDYLERPWDTSDLPAQLATLLRSRTSLARGVRGLKDDRLRLLATYAAVAEGHEPRDVPAWAGVTSYVEHTFGAWTVTGGMAVLASALERRLATRGVAVLTGTSARDVVVRGGRAVAVATDSGPVDAEVVVVACDPRRLPALGRYVERTMPAMPPVVCHVGLEGDLPELPHQTVLHGDPMLTVLTHGPAWTVHARGRADEDLLVSLARRGIDVRRQVVSRVDRSPRDLVEGWGGSPLGVRWQGRRTTFRRLGPTTPVPGVYAVGAHATPGAGLPYVGLSAALVAQVVGPA